MRYAMKPVVKLFSLLSMSVLTVGLFTGVSQTQANDDLLAEDWLSQDTLFTGNIAGLESTEAEQTWRDGFITSVEHSHTQIEEGRQYQRSNLRLQYEYAVANGWFLSLDHKSTYYWQDDAQGQAQDEDYLRGDWQQAWLQFSRGACAYKAGKQTLFWGNVEGTFAVDVVTPFDYTEQLLTDYASIRLAQPMALAECFLSDIQTQVFYIPQARLDLTSHRQQIFAKETDDEYGASLKYSWEGGDLSLYAARLFANQPVLVLGDSIFPGLPGLPEFQYQSFEFYGLSSSIAVSRLLLKADLGFKQNQLVQFSGEQHDVVEFAAGFEYTTATNHNFNAGFWVIKDLEERFDESESKSQSPWYTAGWSKTYLNDDLSMSLLSNITTDPELYSLTVLGQYQYDDYWQFSAALGLSELKGEQVEGLPVPPDESLTLQAKYQF